MTELFDIVNSYVTIVLNALESALTYIFYFPILNSNVGSIFISTCLVIFFFKLVIGWITHKKDGGS